MDGLLALTFLRRQQFFRDNLPVDSCRQEVLLALTNS